MAEMRRVTVRFGESLWNLIEDESNHDGVSAAHWIRDAALARALWERRRRGATNGIEVLQVVREEHRAEDDRRREAWQAIFKYANGELDRLIGKLPPGPREYFREIERQYRRD
jgi:hypothetical protein